jgi:hypothetical protein
MKRAAITSYFLIGTASDSQAADHSSEPKADIARGHPDCDHVALPQIACIRVSDLNGSGRFR